jgi:2,4-dienoyl-CoA reductase-like NADH-dependent reductase (Old Yellow Enzyme family)
MKFPLLFSPLKVGPYQLAHRVMMAPLTRMRAEKPGLVPRPLNAEYYAQRATAGGLLIAEASPVTATGFGSPGVPGIYTEQQIEGWRKVADAVHAKGGVIFLQLWHVGRVSHSSFQPGGVLPVAPSAVPISADLRTATADGKVVNYETPRALETSEIPGVVDAYRQAARNALKAGFDGVEVHGANGYLIEQFLQSHTNLRTDRYGGSIENRTRFLLEVTKAVVEVWGANRVGVRLSPYGVAKWQRRARSDAALQPRHRGAQSAWPCLFAFHRTALERRRPRRGQPSERALRDGAVQAGLEGRAGHRRRLYRRGGGSRCRRRSRRRHRLWPHLHFQSRPTAAFAVRLSADAL